MTEYIERKIATNVIGNIDTSHPYDDKDDIVEQAIGLIDHIPSADVAPVRHGRWERTADGAALCTACKRKMNPSQYGYAFCGLCGAKMDLSVECKQDGERKEGAENG